ncbi:MAG: DNA methyltransferase [Propionivibrio sp.]
MAQYLTAARIKAAVDSLADTKGKATLIDFLILKRTLAIKKATKVAITQGEPAYIQASQELIAVWSKTKFDLKAEREVFNVFASLDKKLGFRSGKYISNGTGSTIGGNPWQTVVSLTGDSPRLASLRDDYEGHLANLLLKEAPKTDKPSLYQSAVWRLRRTDVEPLLASLTEAAGRAKALRDYFVAECGLTQKEIDALFSDAGPGIEDTDLTDKAAEPADYLVGLSASVVADASSNPDLCSLELVAALAAKPFVILTGTSGTGKSRSTLKLAEQLQEHYGASVKGQIFQLVPIGPDWTSPKKLLGYRTPFGRERLGKDGKPTNESYEITETLRVILRACHPDSTKIPHFLIFDEMNLSHVERYFAPFLSLMEASAILDDDENAPIIDSHSLVVISEILDAEDKDSPEAESASFLVANDQPLKLPPNLFYVGTVNIDETTYMFSPKVLDRAHVLEIKALTPTEYLSGAATEAQIGIGAANDLLREAIDDRETGILEAGGIASVLNVLAAKHGFDETALEGAKALTLKALDGCFKLLAPVGFEFGYRVVKEVHHYMLAWCKVQLALGLAPAAILDKWIEGLDLALFQKVLPKIHGNRAALGDSLKALAAFLVGSNEANDPPAKYALGIDAVFGIPPGSEISVPAGVRFKRSIDKLNDMHTRLISRNHVSFVK